jgi:membrane protein DedA with SNARE-associated domain
MVRGLITALVFAVIGGGMALLDQAYLAGSNTQTKWLWVCLPWALLGAVVGFIVGRRKQDRH